MPPAAVDAVGGLATDGWQGKRDIAILTLALWLRSAPVRGARPQARRGAAERDAGDHRQRQQAAAAAGPAGGARSGRRLPRRLPPCAGGGRAALCRRPRRAAQPAPRAAPDGSGARRISAFPKPRPRMPCGTALRRIFSAPAAICARSRNCWATPACRRRSATPRSRPSASSPIYDAAHPRARLARGDQTR